MITVYELRWSHYCEKVRLALDYMGLPWRSVGIDAFRKSELQSVLKPAHLPNLTVPAIHDDLRDVWVMDSTPILRYLAQAYPERPALFPGDAANQAAVEAKLLEFDSLLGLAARRFAYTQVILECPQLLAELFLDKRAGGWLTRAPFNYVAGALLGMLLIQRFEFHHSEQLGLYEALEQYLLQLADQLAGRRFVVGEQFSAADLALAAQLRPLTIVPFFAEHPGLKGLFARQFQVLTELNEQGEFPYQRAIAAVRQRRPACRRYLRPAGAALPFQVQQGRAANDQQPVWNWRLLAMPYHYWFTLRKNTVRQAQASALLR